MTTVEEASYALSKIVDAGSQKSAIDFRNVTDFDGPSGPGEIPIGARGHRKKIK